MFKLGQHQWAIEGSVITLTCQYFPTQEDTIEQVEKWLQAMECRIADISIGADRAQIQFVSKQDTFIFCYDGTCEALWIENTGIAESTSLPKLLAKLDTIQ